MKKFVQDNGGMLAVGAVALAIATGYLDWRIDQIASDKIDTDAVKPHELQLVAAEVRSLKETVNNNHDLTSDQIDDIGDRLNSLINILVEDNQ